MICTQCGSRMKCTDSRPCDAGVRRRYKCSCGNLFTTAEVIVGKGAERSGVKGDSCVARLIGNRQYAQERIVSRLRIARESIDNAIKAADGTLFEPEA